jgi:hypothetical protein
MRERLTERRVLAGCSDIFFRIIKEIVVKYFKDFGSYLFLSQISIL